jgi:hypothetical protein
MTAPPMVAAAASAVAAQSAAGNNVRGIDADMAPSNAMLGTAAYLDQTWIHKSFVYSSPYLFISHL